MQTPKPSSSAVPQKMSPATPKSNRASKSNCSESDSNATHSTTKSVAQRSPKVVRSPGPQKKRPGRVSGLESQIADLQEDLKKTKDQLASSEVSKQRAQKDAEEGARQNSTLSAKLEDSERRLVEFSAAEDDRLQELRKISQERDRAWQLELEAIQKQHSIDFSTAVSEVQRLKIQLDVVIRSEAAHAKQYAKASSKLQQLQHEMNEALSLIENLRIELRGRDDALSKAQETDDAARQELVRAGTAIESLDLEKSNLLEALNAKVTELEASRTRVKSLEESVKKLKGVGCGSDSEVEVLKKALIDAETKRIEEQTENMMQAESAHELVKLVCNDNAVREAELKQILAKAEAEIHDLKADLISKETELQRLVDINKELTAETTKLDANILEPNLTKSNTEITELRESLSKKHAELENVSTQNVQLMIEIKKLEAECQNYDSAIAKTELARASEKDALMRLEIATEEADKSSRRAALASEQLVAAQTATSEMEVELKRLKVQNDQWRKAAEAAAAMERAVLMDREYGPLAGKLTSSPLSDDLDDESPRKRNVNMLRKIGSFLKKGPK